MACSLLLATALFAAAPPDDSATTTATATATVEVEVEGPQEPPPKKRGPRLSRFSLHAALWGLKTERAGSGAGLLGGIELRPVLKGGHAMTMGGDVAAHVGPRLTGAMGRLHMGYRYTFRFGLEFHALAGLGAHYGKANLGEDPCPCKAAGIPDGPSAMAFGGLGVGFDLGAITGIPIAAYARYEKMGLMNFDIDDGVARFVPADSVMVGLRLHLGKRVVR